MARIPSIPLLALAVLAMPVTSIPIPGGLGLGSLMGTATSAAQNLNTGASVLQAGVDAASRIRGAGSSAGGGGVDLATTGSGSGVTPDTLGPANTGIGTGKGYPADSMPSLPGTPPQQPEIPTTGPNGNTPTLKAGLNNGGGGMTSQYDVDAHAGFQYGQPGPGDPSGGMQEGLNLTNTHTTTGLGNPDTVDQYGSNEFPDDQNTAFNTKKTPEYPNPSQPGNLPTDYAAMNPPQDTTTPPTW